MKPSVVENEGPSVVHVIIKAPTFSEAEVTFAKYMMDYSPNGYGTSEVDRFTDEDGLATIKVWRLASCD